MQLISTIHIGKNGLTENVFETIKDRFKNHQNVRIIFLKAAGRDREKIKQGAEEIVSKLGRNYTYRIIGFTIFLKKWRKSQR